MARRWLEFAWPVQMKRRLWLVMSGTAFGGAYGTLTLQANGTYTYKPNAVAQTIEREIAQLTALSTRFGMATGDCRPRP